MICGMSFDEVTSHDYCNASDLAYWQEVKLEHYPVLLHESKTQQCWVICCHPSINESALVRCSTTKCRNVSMANLHHMRSCKHSGC